MSDSIPLSSVLYAAVVASACHAFPTRRSSDLWQQLRLRAPGRGAGGIRLGRAPGERVRLLGWAAERAPRRVLGAGILLLRRPRSEEHTSELQSLTNLVCRLLLEKKKEQSMQRI